MKRKRDVADTAQPKKAAKGNSQLFIKTCYSILILLYTKRKIWMPVLEHYIKSFIAQISMLLFFISASNGATSKGKKKQ